MFRALVSPILKSTRLRFYSFWYKAPTMLQVRNLQHRRCFLPEAVKTQSSAPEDVRNYRPNRVELIEVINKLSLLHLVGCLYYYVNDARSRKHKKSYRK